MTNVIEHPNRDANLERRSNVAPHVAAELSDTMIVTVPMKVGSWVRGEIIYQMYCAAHHYNVDLSHEELDRHWSGSALQISITGKRLNVHAFGEAFDRWLAERNTSLETPHEIKSPKRRFWQRGKTA